MLYSMERKPLIKGQSLMKEGDPMTHIYIISRGEVEILKKIEVQIEQEEKDEDILTLIYN